MVLDGRYKLASVLGRGSHAVVYRARQRALERDVAIKVLRRAEARDPEARTRFLEEAKTMAQLSSPHTVEVHDFGRLPDGGAYLVMELVEGRTLADVLAEDGPLGAARCASIFEGVAAALSEAHGRGIVHRDIKPANVIIASSDGRARVIDFGISVRRDRGLRWTHDGDLLGTPAYMAPEQWSSEFGAIGPATDQYAVGVMLYEALTKTLPFSAATPARMMGAHLVARPSALPDSVERRTGLDAVVRRCLAKAPGARFPSVAHFSQSMRRCVATTHTHRVPTESSPSVATLFQSHRNFDASQPFHVSWPGT